MFENLNSLSVSGFGRSAPRLESLEDRTTPAVVGAASTDFGAAGVGVTGVNGFNAGFDTSAFNNFSLGQASALDRAFVSEVGRLSLMQAFLGTVAANQGADQQVRAFGARLAANQFALFNRVSPLLDAGGLNVQLTAVDRAVINVLPALSGAALDSQFLALSSFYGMQASGLAQFGSAFGTGAAVRSFAGSQFSALQGQLQSGFDLLGGGSNANFNTMFGTLGGFGPFTASGLGTTGFNATGAFNSPFGGGFNNGFGGFGSSGFNTFGTVGAGGGFGPGASFGTSTGFGPANATTGFGGGFGPGASFGTTGTGTGTGTFGTSGTGTPIF